MIQHQDDLCTCGHERSAHQDARIEPPRTACLECLDRGEPHAYHTFERVGIARWRKAPLAKALLRPIANGLAILLQRLNRLLR